MKLLHVRKRQRAERALTADRQVPVGMALIEQFRERAVRKCRWHVSHLHEPVQTEIADAVEVSALESRALDHVAEQRETAVGETGQHRQAEQRGIGADLGVDLSADAPQRLVEPQRVERPGSPRPADRR